MQNRHADTKQYFEEQALTTQKYVIPFIDEVGKVDNSQTVLEIGCGEGGNLKPFIELGCKVTGIDYAPQRIESAQHFFELHPNQNNATFICDDIYNRTSTEGKYNVIIMRDVIEHIHDQEKFMGFVKQFLDDNGLFFLGFPPWYMPFGGHQQVCKSKFLSRLPWFHILPKYLYSGILKIFGESPKLIADLLEIKQTGISLDRFERIVKKENFVIKKRSLYFINPNYEIKFGMKPKEQLKWLTAIPFARNFYVTAGYYVLALK